MKLSFDFARIFIWKFSSSFQLHLPNDKIKIFVFQFSRLDFSIVRLFCVKIEVEKVFPTTLQSFSSCLFTPQNGNHGRANFRSQKKTFPRLVKYKIISRDQKLHIVFRREFHSSICFFLKTWFIYLFIFFFVDLNLFFFFF